MDAHTSKNIPKISTATQWPTIMAEDNEPMRKEAQQIKTITKIINQHTT